MMSICSYWILQKRIANDFVWNIIVLYLTWSSPRRPWLHSNRVNYTIYNNLCFIICTNRLWITVSLCRILVDICNRQHRSVFHQLINEHEALILLPPANEVWGKVIFSVACVKNSVHRGTVCLSACWDTTPQADNPPGADPPEQTSQSRPPEQTPLQCMLGDMVNKRAVCILLECNLVCFICSVLQGMDITV